MGSELASGHGPTMESLAARLRCDQSSGLWLVALIASVALVSCGSGTSTVAGTSNGVSTYLVVSGNSDDVAQLMDYYTSGGGGGHVVDGDQHSGELICEHDSSKNGHVVHIALRGRHVS